ncbi:MAG: membrane protein insertion efficiency factor YidD [Candidatus Omnitrophica bacterium]|nr:membrane protein insertion efficiency factor YidD [Candidatus Omnitrophota bacterium]
MELKDFLIFLIRIYRALLTPIFGPCCRFYPSCSTYAEEAISRKGPLAGTLAALRRLTRCHPFHPGGVDLPE